MAPVESAQAVPGLPEGGGRLLQGLEEAQELLAPTQRQPARVLAVLQLLETALWLLGAVLLLKAPLLLVLPPPPLLVLPPPPLLVLPPPPLLMLPPPPRLLVLPPPPRLLVLPPPPPLLLKPPTPLLLRHWHPLPLVPQAAAAMKGSGGEESPAIHPPLHKPQMCLSACPRLPAARCQPCV